MTVQEIILKVVGANELLNQYEIETEVVATIEMDGTRQRFIVGSISNLDSLIECVNRQPKISRILHCEIDETFEDISTFVFEGNAMLVRVQLLEKE